MHHLQVCSTISRHQQIKFRTWSKFQEFQDNAQPRSAFLHHAPPHYEVCTFTKRTRFQAKSDTVAVFAVLPRYPRYYRGIHDITAVSTVLPRYPRYYRVIHDITAVSTVLPWYPRYYRVIHDITAVSTVLPWYPRYYRGNGIVIHDSTAVMGLELTVFQSAVVGTTSTRVPWEWGLPLPERYIIFGLQ